MTQQPVCPGQSEHTVPPGYLSQHNAEQHRETEDTSGTLKHKAEATAELGFWAPLRVRDLDVPVDGAVHEKMRSLRTPSGLQVTKATVIV